jgi:hypothetical protein
MNDEERQEYMDAAGYTQRQKDYINLLASTFNMKNSRGDRFPYQPEPYQCEYHAECMLANPNFQNRIWRKARGVGATATTMMDALMIAHRYNNVNIPVASITGTQSSAPVDWAIYLADNTQIPDFFDRRQDINSKCILGNGSQIFAVPGHNPEALRTFRTIANIYDEFSFHPYATKLKTAGDSCLSEGGQINMLSTLNGTENEFYKTLDNAEYLGYKVFDVPMFDPAVFDVDRPIPDQIAEGLIKPISPWVNIQKLEDSRRFDKTAFMQEQMCQAEDSAVSFLSLNLLDQCSRLPMVIEQHKRQGLNPYVLGIDFASSHDTSAFEIFEFTPNGWIHRKRLPVRKQDTVQQVALVKSLHASFNFKYITVDMTGSGTGFYHYTKSEIKTNVVGINFNSRHTIDNSQSHYYRSKDIIQGKNGKISIPIKRAMATYMKMEMEQNRVLLQQSDDYLADLHSVPYENLDAPRSKDAHGDEFWGTALALWGYHVNEHHIIKRPYVMRY